MIQTAVTGKSFIPLDKHSTPLNEGDNLTFMLLLAGGSILRPVSWVISMSPSFSWIPKRASHSPGPVEDEDSPRAT